MSDLHILLDQAAGPSIPPSPSVVDTDLARGRHALRRARGRRYGIGGGLVAAAAAAAIVVSAAGSGLGDSAPSGAVAAGGTGDPARESMMLVSYTGEAPVGFTLATVPAGWEVQDSNTSSFVLAPQGQARPNGSFEGNIVVSLAADVPDQVTGTDVTVKGAPATIMANAGGDGTRTLYQAQSSGAYLTIQVWGGLPLNDAQLVDLANGIGIAADAHVTHG